MNKNTGTTMHKIWMLHLFKQKAAHWAKNDKQLSD